MEIEIFAPCSRFEVDPEDGPTLYGFGPQILLPCPPDKFVVTILLAVVFDENDWQAPNVSLQLYDEKERLVSSEDTLMRPGEVVNRGERRWQSWELPGKTFDQPGYYVAVLLVDGVATRRTILGAMLRPPAAEGCR